MCVLVNATTLSLALVLVCCVQHNLAAVLSQLQPVFDAIGRDVQQDAVVATTLPGHGARHLRKHLDMNRGAVRSESFHFCRP